MRKLLHKVDFDPYINHTFQIHSKSAGPVKVELVELTEKNYKGQENFSLLFRGPKELILPQMIYNLTHPEMGEIELFLVPVHCEKQDGIYYQSVFSRLLDEK